MKGGNKTGHHLFLKLKLLKKPKSKLKTIFLIQLRYLITNGSLSPYFSLNIIVSSKACSCVIFAKALVWLTYHVA